MERIAIYDAGKIEGDDAIFATTPDGDVYVFDGQDVPDHRAAAFVAAVKKRGSIDPELWHYWRTTYGSAAYVSRGIEMETAFKERYEGWGEGDDLAHVY